MRTSPIAPRRRSRAAPWRASIESLVARNALALSIAANGAFRDRAGEPCVATAQSLALSPAVARRFIIRNPMGEVICSSGGFRPRRDDLLAAPGDIRLWVSPARSLHRLSRRRGRRHGDGRAEHRRLAGSGHRRRQGYRRADHRRWRFGAQDHRARGREAPASSRCAARTRSAAASCASRRRLPSNARPCSTRWRCCCRC